MNHGIVSYTLVGPFNVGSKSIGDSKREPPLLEGEEWCPDRKHFLSL